MNVFAKNINGYQGELKTLSNIWDAAFPQAVTEYRGEFRILTNICDEAPVFLDYD